MPEELTVVGIEARSFEHFDDPGAEVLHAVEVVAAQDEAGEAVDFEEAEEIEVAYEEGAAAEEAEVEAVDCEEAEPIEAAVEEEAEVEAVVESVGIADVGVVALLLP